MIIQVLQVWVVILTILGLYFSPAIYAIHINHKDKGLITFLNIFFGWTIIGWVGCLIWAGKK